MNVYEKVVKEIKKAFKSVNATCCSVSISTQEEAGMYSIVNGDRYDEYEYEGLISEQDSEKLDKLLQQIAYVHDVRLCDDMDGNLLVFVDKTGKGMTDHNFDLTEG